ncbi:hypothetical protein CH381_27360, partial [Leptospira sp. mixed culture ATI2-C-A1]
RTKPCLGAQVSHDGEPVERAIPKMGYKIKPIFRLAVASPYEFRDQATLGSASLPSAQGRPSPTYPSRGGGIPFS